MKIGIIAAMPEELKILVENLENAEKHLRLGHVYHTGNIGRHEVVLVESGIGKVMSAMSVAVLVNEFKVTAVINTGSAGAVAEGLQIGDIVVADRLVYHDVDVTAFGYEYGQMARQPLYFEASRYLVSEMKKTLEKTHQTSRVGLIATGDSFIASQDKIDRIKGHFPEVLAIEMEGAAVAQATHSIGLPFMVIRAMSDTASHDANISFDEFIHEASKRSADTLIQFLKELV
ncbi:5'-methylthioadenosine/adenosylhomocysteine nucleosidase [Streptococcus periodonticum]|uniref:5'-methylthioadenosine/adenosylhomocysteine nucleosidase n=1 Tax=Streptococcus periodonticum TaxID=2490633 RepID=UPI00157F9538|nr:5'-methylthioadenosine/adenosylhomocysteine nucleosidase [Streptococcus periodonticum]